MKHLLLSILLLTTFALHAEETIRICDNTGCSERPRSTSAPIIETNLEEEHRLAELSKIASKDPRAAYDLGLRYFRGDGVRQNSYQALQWMRDAGERGDLRAQSALGQFYLTGFGGIGSDFAEAEKWLSIAADRGDEQANQLLAKARAAKKAEHDDYQWREQYRREFYGYWYSGYAYYSYWLNSMWYFY